MAQRDHRPVGKRLVDALVVVASILAAFSLDAWWDHRQERAAVAEDLANVAEELQLNRQDIEFGLDIMRRAGTGSELLATAILEAMGQSTVSVPDTVTFWAFQSVTFDPSLGAVDALLASGRLRQVDDPKLRMALAGLRDKVRDAVEEQIRATRMIDEQVIPAFAELGFNPGIGELDGWFWSLDRVPGREVESRGDLVAPVSPALALFVGHRAALFRIATGEMERLSAEMAEVVDRIGTLTE
jgi:hypothetical protein